MQSAVDGAQGGKYLLGDMKLDCWSVSAQKLLLAKLECSECPLSGEDLKAGEGVRFSC